MRHKITYIAALLVTCSVASAYELKVMKSEVFLLNDTKESRFQKVNPLLDITPTAKDGYRFTLAVITYNPGKSQGFSFGLEMDDGTLVSPAAIQHPLLHAIVAVSNSQQTQPTDGNTGPRTTVFTFATPADAQPSAVTAKWRESGEEVRKSFPVTTLHTDGDAALEKYLPRAKIDTVNVIESIEVRENRERSDTKFFSVPGGVFVRFDVTFDVEDDALHEYASRLQSKPFRIEFADGNVGIPVRTTGIGIATYALASGDTFSFNHGVIQSRGEVRPATFLFGVQATVLPRDFTLFFYGYPVGTAKLPSPEDAQSTLLQQ